jgi:hypothetical protein
VAYNSSPTGALTLARGIPGCAGALAYVGHAESRDAVEVIGNLATRDATVVYRRAGRVLAVLTVGRDRQSLAVEAALERGDVAGLESLLRS